jgi:hypothetical protein
MILMCNFLGSEMRSAMKAKKRRTLIFPLCCIKVNPSSWVASRIVYLADVAVLCGNHQMVDDDIS